MIYLWSFPSPLWAQKSKPCPKGKKGLTSKSSALVFWVFFKEWVKNGLLKITLGVEKYFWGRDKKNQKFLFCVTDPEITIFKAASFFWRFSLSVKRSAFGGGGVRTKRGSGHFCISLTGSDQKYFLYIRTVDVYLPKVPCWHGIVVQTPVSAISYIFLSGKMKIVRGNIGHRHLFWAPGIGFLGKVLLRLQG